jgi:beta-galactosidase
MMAIVFSAVGAWAGQRVYEVGTVYVYYSWTSDAQIVRDLETIAATGIKAINPYPPFLVTPGHPEPDFSKADLVQRTAERLGLRVMPTLFRTAMLPDLAAAKWPERAPSPIIDNRTREGRLSLADPQVLALVDDYVAATVRHLKDDPSLVAWNVWVEAGFETSMHDPHADQWFEEWGKKKYGNTDAWYAQWNDMHFNYEYNRIDRILFQWASTARVVEHLADLVKSIDPSHPTGTHSVGSTVVKWGVSSNDDWTTAKGVDEYGLSFYPDIPARESEDKPEVLEKEKALWDTPWTTSLELTAAHDATGGKPFVLMEVQTGPRTGFTRYGYEPGTIFNYDRIHLLAWQSAAHDSKAIYFWQWLPHLDDLQAFGRGLAASDGSVTSRAVAAGDASRALNSDPDLFLDSKPVPAPVAVVCDVTGDLKAKLRGGDWQSFTARNLIGIYRVLWRDQVRINVLDGRQVTAASLKPYKLVIFPFYLCLRSNVAEAIASYVASGGTVLADARFGIIDERDRGYPVNPGLGMAKLFGARRHDLVASHSPSPVRISDAVGLGKGVTLPTHLVGGVFREELQLEKGSEGKVVGVFEASGTPAVVVRHVGKGETILLGFSLGIPLLEQNDQGAAGLLRAVLKAAGVEPAIRVTTAADAGPVEDVVHSRGRADERLIYLLNWGHRPTQVTAELPWPGQTLLRGKDFVSGRSVPVQHRGNHAVFTLTLPADHAAAVEIRP